MSDFASGSRVGSAFHLMPAVGSVPVPNRSPKVCSQISFSPCCTICSKSAGSDVSGTRGPGVSSASWNRSV